jgi:hypothetical protein
MEKKPMTRDEEADEIVRRLKTKPVSPSDFQRIVMPIIRKIIPGTIANEIMGVQPMSESLAKIYSVKIKDDK